MDTYEKKYKEIVGQIKKAYLYAQTDSTKAVLENIFPELKESEDELTWLTKYIEEEAYYLSMDIRDNEDHIKLKNLQRSLAWLEKQGTSYTKRDVDEAFVEGMACAKNELEKQSEQKSIDKVEPKFKVKYAGSEYNVFETKDIAGVTFYGIEDEPNHIDYVKADNCEIINGGYGIKENGFSVPTKPIMFSEQKPTWSVEDMSKVQRICKYLNEAKKYYADITEVRECIDWLKSIKDRVQPKQGEQKPTDNDMVEALRTEYEKGRADAIAEMQKEWGEEDEKRLQSCINILKAKSLMGKVDTANTMWLKSLKERIGE